MKHLSVGEVHHLEVRERTEYGYFLTDGSEDILLHNNEVQKELNEGDTVEVFLYNDKLGRIAATTVIPEVQVGKYGWVDVVEVKENLGVFVNVGIQKDILVSEDDLPVFSTLWPTIGDRLYVALSYDQRGRLIAKPATEDVIQSIANAAPLSLRNQSISGIVYRLLKVGSFMISKEGYRCFIHESERIEEPRLGEEIEGRVIEVKEDGSLNMSLLPRKQERIDDDAEAILEYMETRGGGMPFGDKSDANDINMDFQMSKSAFKRALGKLIKENKIYQENGWTYLQKHAAKHDES